MWLVTRTFYLNIFDDQLKFIRSYLLFTKWEGMGEREEMVEEIP